MRVYGQIQNVDKIVYSFKLYDDQILYKVCPTFEVSKYEKFKLPSVEKMIEQTTKETEVTKRKTRFYKRHCISTFSINHRDEICEEMEWNSWRKKNWISEAFSPYGNQDYI